MLLDLRKDYEDIYSYLVRRVHAFDPSKKKGPGDANAPISQIELGYQCDQAGWVALVFDTRPKAEPDGHWQSYIAANIFERPHWQEAFELLETKAVDFVLLDGSKHNIPPYGEDGENEDYDEEEHVAIFGELLKSVLLKARAEGLFDLLPKATECHLGVEEHDGRYGWPHYEDRGKEDLV
jgi:hypothetical protein